MKNTTEHNHGAISRNLAELIRWGTEDGPWRVQFDGGNAGWRKGSNPVGPLEAVAEWADGTRALLVCDDHNNWQYEGTWALDSWG